MNKIISYAIRDYEHKDVMHLPVFSESGKPTIKLVDWARMNHWNQKKFAKALMTVAIAEHEATEKQMAGLGIREELLKRMDALNNTPDFALRLELNNFYLWLKGETNK